MRVSLARLAAAAMTAVETVPTGVSLAFADGARTTLGHAVLRDSCPCPRCVDPATSQRVAMDLPSPTVRPVAPPALTGDAGALRIDWGDHVSEFPASLLRSLAPPQRLAVPRAAQRVLWDATGPVPSVPYAAMVASGSALRHFLHHMAVRGFCIVDGAPGTLEATRDAARRTGRLRETFYGGKDAVWDFRTDGAMADSAYSTVPIGCHTDGTYLTDSPRLQVFHVLEYDGTGGESLVLDGFKVLEQMRAEMPAEFDALCRVPLEFGYDGDGMKLRVTKPVVTLDDAGDLLQIRFNGYDRRATSFEDPELMHRAIGWLATAVQDPRNVLSLGTLRPGKILFVDNWRVLHGRTEVLDPARHVCGTYVDNDEYESTQRTQGEE